MPAPKKTSETLKQECRVDLTFPFHPNHLPLQRLAALQKYFEAEQHSSDYYLAGSTTTLLEEKLARLFGKQAAMWCPTGTMAQGIAAQIYAERSGHKGILLHPTSHLLLHEEEGYDVLHGLEAYTIGKWREPVDADMLQEGLACAILELPQRHSGGQLPTWDQLNAIKTRAANLDLPLHMDGARIWSCRPFYSNRSYAEIVDGFSSVYVSLYKDIGAMAGAALVGDHAFIEEAKIWRARMGGLLVDATMMVADSLRLLDHRLPQMAGFVGKAKEFSSAISDIPTIEISPKEPQVNMFHVLLPCMAEVAEKARDTVAEHKGIWLSNRFWNYEGPNKCAMEITVGEHADALSVEDFAAAINMFVREISN